jgi:hypothetical protein
MESFKESADLSPEMPLMPLNEVEFLHIVYAMFACAGNRTLACKKLQISIRTLRNKLNEYEVTKNLKFPLPTSTGSNFEPRHNEFRNKFLTLNQLENDGFKIEKVKVVEREIKILISDFGFPAYLAKRLFPEYVSEKSPNQIDQ